MPFSFYERRSHVLITPKTERSNQEAPVTMSRIANVRLIASFIEITFYATLLLHKSQEFRHRFQGSVRMRITANHGGSQIPR